jgi:hypothetical protein
MRPNQLIARAYFTRGAWLWLGARLLSSAAIALGKMNPFEPSFAASAVVVTIATTLGAVDVVRRHERAFLENLGVSRAMLLVFFAGPALVGELIILLAWIART